ncbi:MAG: hypothetical protein K6G81_03640 [Lachnospiraceae bacterium]|nr:hypothetical protein [Lachnospiraceae bacterium]
MTKMTSAYANKVIRKLNEDKEFWLNKEREGSTYVAAADEEPVIPDYDYENVAKQIEELDARILKVKHAINVNNASNRIKVNDMEMSIDEILVRMAQLSNRKAVLDIMRKRETKKRINSGYYTTRKTSPEFEYINYDLETVKKEYERVDAEIAAMQIALDKYNQTFEFDVED